MPKETTKYFVVAAPGYYGDKTRVVSSHHTLNAAHKRRGAFECVREGSLVKGAAFLRVYESMCARIEADGTRHGAA